MFNLLQGAGDDQIALLGCLVALVGSSGLMYLSFFVGPANRQAQKNRSAEIHQMPVRTVDPTRERAA
jgi:hypothetical protein